ncbi:uncharacterized protein B0P05DRAFT_571533 [Gilbertella persicaria]|uniref:uncharacterized protein n=1 Tax=Gilbertella persicaria TaxID=101096 RepID=UPI00222001AD|nr:uncharacterized protein B0P05DRAFT_571533 [Gilbertella persicaria]KAI8079617.1 hypothetical protein B0P05DRAFT_571533 [Gilbertella persicaria]
MEEEVLQKIYKLANELAHQQQHNQDLASSLTHQLSDLKSKTNAKPLVDEHDVSLPHPTVPEQRDEVIEQLKSQLQDALSAQKAALETNKQLEKQVDDLQALVKEYEVGLETVTSKLRLHANAVTEGQIRLKREYEALLNAEKGTTAALFMENTLLQTQLRQLARSLRDVYQYESIDPQDQLLAQLKKENQALLKLLRISQLSEEVITERSSPVLSAARPGVVEEFFE